jgi:hypothetical protein
VINDGDLVISEISLSGDINHYSGITAKTAMEGTYLKAED